ncbi:phosphatase PAP2 family protein [Candidatus Thorarchaeota archaeon]|nr:MAG: phosphatase PAP2 family protein [Candidatus Thorarchaeota archaeon]
MVSQTARSFSVAESTHRFQVTQLFFDPDLTLAFRDALPWAGELFRLITELGSETFYVVVVLVGYWAYKKRASVILLGALLISLVANYWLKYVIGNPRPDPSYWYEGMEASNYSTPSGHAQNSATVFGWAGTKSKNAVLLVISIVIAVLIGLSRVYLGVHYLGDILIGWAVGFGIVAILYYAEEPIRSALSRYRTEYIYGAIFLSALAVLSISSFLPQPPGDNFGALAGLTMGVAIAFPLEQKYVGFTVDAPKGEKWRLVLRIVIGLALAMVALLGLSPVLPTSNLWLRAIRYGLVAVLGGLVWPAIFTKVGL